MTPEATIALSAIDLALAAALVLVAGVVSLGLRLDLERRLAWASVRTVLQLLLIGYLLRWVFDVGNVWTVFAIMAVMLVAASRAAVQRASRTIAGAHVLALITLVTCGLTTTLLATGVIVSVDPWWAPRYAIPLLGMVLGNGLTGLSLCLDQVLEGFSEKRGLVEMELAHGATRWEASRDVLRNSVRKGMIPIINSMMVVGIVSLPGMMTGQILAGADPVEAVKYQIVIMFMIAAATSGGCMLMAWLVYRRVFNDDHQLLAERFSRR